MKAIFRKVVEIFRGFQRSQLIQLGIKRTDLVDPEWNTRQKRKESRFMLQYRRFLSQLDGGPVLTGARLDRVTRQCSPSNLLVQPKYPNLLTEI